MAALTFERIDQAKLPLIKKFYKASRYSPKTNKNDEIYVLREGPGQPICGAVRLTQLDRYLMLRSMVISPARRGKGYGSYFLQQLATVLEGRDCWCYPFKELTEFYGQIDFESIAAEDCPPAIREKFLQYIQHGKPLDIMLRRASA